MPERSDDTEEDRTVTVHAERDPDAKPPYYGRYRSSERSKRKRLPHRQWIYLLLLFGGAALAFLVAWLVVSWVVGLYV